MFDKNELALILESVRNGYNINKLNNPKDVRAEIQYRMLIDKLEKEIGVEKIG